MTELKINKRRDFGECIADGFKLLGNNFKAFITAFLIYVSPLIAITSMLLYYFGKSLFNDLSAEMTTSPYLIISLYGGLFLGSIMLSAIIYAVFLASLENENEAIKFSDIKNYILWIFFQIIPIYLINIVLLVLPLIVVSILSTMSTIFFVLFGAYVFYFFYMMMPLFLAPFIKVNERSDIVTAYKRAFYLVKGNWFPTFGVFLISYIISSMAASILVLPIYIITILKAFSSIETGNMSSDTGFWFVMTMIIGLVGSLLSTAYYLACINLKYFDLLEKKDGTALLNKIDQFGTNSESVFENEGDF